MTNKESATTEASFLLDKTPLEIRLMIFRLVLRAVAILREAESLAKNPIFVHSVYSVDSTATDAKVSTAFLAGALGWYQKWRILQRHPDTFEANERQNVLETLEFMRVLGQFGPWEHHLLPENVKLEDLTVEHPSVELVERATNLLGVNLVQLQGRLSD